MAEFLPRGRSDGARLVLDAARSGTATGLVLIGIDGAPAPELARIARAMAAALPGTGLFRTVAGGPPPAAEMQALFADRYALSPAVTAAAFTVPALRAGFEGVLRQLRSSAAPLALQFGLPDPTGAFPAMLRAWGGSGGVRVIDGAWFDADGRRALLLARDDGRGDGRAGAGGGAGCGAGGVPGGGTGGGAGCW